MFDAQGRGWLHPVSTFLEGRRRRSDDCALAWLLSKEDQVMARSGARRWSFRKRNVDSLFASIPHCRYTRHRASDGNVLKLPAAVLSAQNVGPIRIVREHCDDIEWLRWASGERELHIDPFVSAGRRNDAERKMFSSSIIAKRSLERRVITAHKLIATIQDHLWRVGALGQKPRSVDALPIREHWRGIWIFPTEIIPVRHVFTDTDDQLSRVRLLQIDLPEEGVGRWATGTSFRSEKFYDRHRGRCGSD